MKALAIAALAAALQAGVGQGPPPPPWPGPPPPPPREMGLLDVESDPPAAIALDGAPTGLWTPQRFPLPQGHHTVTLFRGERERRPSTYGFVIRRGQTTHLTIHLAW